MIHRYKITGVVSDEKRKDDGRMVSRCWKKSALENANSVLWQYLNKFGERVEIEKILWNRNQNIACVKLDGVMYTCETSYV